MALAKLLGVQFAGNTVATLVSVLPGHKMYIGSTAHESLAPFVKPLKNKIVQFTQGAILAVSGDKFTAQRVHSVFHARAPQGNDKPFVAKSIPNTRARAALKLAGIAPTSALCGMDFAISFDDEVVIPDHRPQRIGVPGWSGWIVKKDDLDRYMADLDQHPEALEHSAWIQSAGYDDDLKTREFKVHATPDTVKPMTMFVPQMGWVEKPNAQLLQVVFNLDTLKVLRIVDHHTGENQNFARYWLHPAQWVHVGDTIPDHLLTD